MIHGSATSVPRRWRRLGGGGAICTGCRRLYGLYRAQEHPWFEFGSSDLEVARTLHPAQTGSLELVKVLLAEEKESTVLGPTSEQ